MSSTQENIVIAGAGIGGLTTALALHAKGIHDVVILEAASEIRPLGVGINIQPAAVAEFYSLGLGDSLAAQGIATRELQYRDHRGRILWTDPRGPAAGDAHPQISIHRGELQVLLRDAVCERLGPRSLRTGIRLQSFVETPAGIRIRAYSRSIGMNEDLDARALIGADGLHSAVRAQLHPDKCELVPADVHMWRGVTELEGFLDGRTMIVANDERSSRLIAYPISARHARQSKAWVNWVCMVPHAKEAESADADWDIAGRLEDVWPYFSHWDRGWLDIESLLSHSPQILQYPMVDRDPLSVWGTGCVTLLGDAAHLMYPVGANGASQAIVDAVTLAMELGNHGDIAEAFRKYEANRMPATSAVIQANRSRDRAERALIAHSDSEKSAELAAITSRYRAVVERRNEGVTCDGPSQNAL